MSRFSPKSVNELTNESTEAITDVMTFWRVTLRVGRDSIAMGFTPNHGWQPYGNVLLKVKGKVVPLH
jgi:hypothetical protein